MNLRFIISSILLTSFLNPTLSGTVQRVQNGPMPFTGYSGRVTINLPSIQHRVGSKKHHARHKSVREYHRESTRKDGNEIEEVSKTDRPETKVPIVETAEGRLRGIVVRKRGYEFYAFLGIHYAEKPRRFKTAEPLKPWNGTRDATEDVNVCIQRLEDVRVFQGTEDCLLLNVATSTIDNSTRLPVLVWIHGGMFKHGGGRFREYNPHRLVRRGLVAVSLQYRLGAFGFLSTGTEHAPGNAGLKDLVEGLRWLRRNIHSFGGDPDNVTLQGISTGAMLVDMLAVSPMARGLFHKIIGQSGAAMSEWSINKDPLREVFYLAKQLNESTGDLDRIMQRLSVMDAMELVKLGEKVVDDRMLVTKVMLYKPVAERMIPGEEPFMTDYPVNLIKSGQYADVPTMMGLNDVEGLFYFNGVVDAENHIKPLNTLLEYMLPFDLLDAIESQPRKEEVVSSVRRLYFGDEPVSLATMRGVMDLIGDVTFGCAVYQEVKVRQAMVAQRKSPLYFLEFATSTPESRFLRTVMKDEPGAGHAEDYYFLFETDVASLMEANNVTETVLDRYLTMVENFAKYGDPTPTTSELLPVKWLPVIEDKMNCLKFTDKLEMISEPYKERCEFWNELHKQYLRPYYF